MKIRRPGIHHVAYTKFKLKFSVFNLYERFHKQISDNLCAEIKQH